MSSFDNRSFKYGLQFFFNLEYFLSTTKFISWELHRQCFAQNIFINNFQFSKCNSILLQISKAHFKKAILEVIRYNFASWVLVTSVFPIFFMNNIAGTSHHANLSKKISSPLQSWLPFCCLSIRCFSFPTATVPLRDSKGSKCILKLFQIPYPPQKLYPKK